MSAFGTAAGQHLPSVFGFHPRPKSVAITALRAAWLISPFHKSLSINSKPILKKAAKYKQLQVKVNLTKGLHEKILQKSTTHNFAWKSRRIFID
ncbi:MAG: hypothetical protein AUJ47_03240 [Candidatus Marinimicrobia bacterium CG1_02_48_14]|nr:MAG: hypothetical protein AUJ47_03240 [Candidatus Marinimicrobia bacterium CG1_02_48_14]